MELELLGVYNSKQRKEIFRIADIINFLGSKGIEASFEGNMEQTIAGLSHVENPENNTIIYSERDKIKFDNNILILAKQKGYNIINTEDPKLAFYYLSHLFYKSEIISNKHNNNNDIYKNLVIGNNGFIGDCIIGKNVIIGHNTVIEDGVIIGDNTVIGNNCSIGCFGLSWTWDNQEKVFLYAVGKTIIGNDCKISSNVKIVRGVFSKSTIIENNVFIAPGTAIGHGVTLRGNVHVANNCSIGGSATISENCFLGCSSTVSTSAFIGKNTILASSCCVKSNQILDEDSVYIGVPAKKHKNIKNKYSLKGVPKK